jgi:hypothetical protein
MEIDRLRGREFLRLMREVRLIHRRNGAFSWRLEEDLTRSNTCRIEMMIPSWTGYLLQRERLTKAEQETINKVWRLHVGEDVPEERYYLCANRELDARGTTVAHFSSMAHRPVESMCPRDTANVASGSLEKNVREQIVPEPETERQKTAAALADPKNPISGTASPSEVPQFQAKVAFVGQLPNHSIVEMLLPAALSW